MRLTTIEPPLSHHYYVGPKLTNFRSAVGSAELTPSQSRGLGDALPTPENPGFRYCGFHSRAIVSARCPTRARFRPSDRFYTTVTSVRGHSGLSISRESFDFRRAQRREGISAGQLPEALVPSESGHQGAAADNELRMDRDCVRLRDAVLPPETQSVREGEVVARGRRRRDGRREPREHSHEEARPHHHRDCEGSPAVLP